LQGEAGSEPRSVDLMSSAVASAGAGDKARLEASYRQHPLARFILRRTAAGLGTLLVVSMLIFAVTNVLPGNVADAVLGRNATPAAVHELEVQTGLNRPAVARYLSWLAGMVHGDFGRSDVAVAEGNPDTSISYSIGTPLANSFILAAATALLLVPLTLVLGMLAGIRAGRTVDHVVSIPALVASGLPEFVTGTFLTVIFFKWLGLLPAVSNVTPGHSPLATPKLLILPVLTLLAVALGSGIRQVRSGMIEVMDQEYFRVATLNGLRGRLLLYRYGLRNGLGPAVQSLGQNLQYLLGGIVIVESVFAYPGIGSYLIQAVSTRDVNEVQAAALILASVYIAINIVSDVIVVMLEPKLRTGLS
jgi:peptide/nickel transport system permease protein